MLPALFGKIKELFGVDLSSQQQGQTAPHAGSGGWRITVVSGRQRRRSTQTGGGAANSSVTAYGTSDNRGYEMRARPATITGAHSGGR